MASKARDFVARFLTDTSKFDTREPVAELDDLADAADATARRMDDSFDRVSRSVGTSLDDTGRVGESRAKAAGGEIGAELAENMGEAFRSGDVTSLVTESLTSLAPALGAAGIGIGIGTALVANMIKGTKAAAEKLQAATQAVVDNIDVDLSTFAAKFDIQQFLNDSIDALTEGGLTEDIARFKKLAAATVGEDTLAKILAGDESIPASAIESLRAQADAAITATGREARQRQLDQQSAAEDVLALLQQQRLAYDRGTDAVQTQVDAQKTLAGYIRTANGLLDAQSIKGLGRFAGKALPTDDR